MPEPPPPSPPTPHDPGRTFSPGELAAVLARFGVGRVRSVHPFPRGSPASPKLIVDAASGAYILKRRAAGQEDPDRVAFAHAVQQHLSERGYPVAGIVRPPDGQPDPVVYAGRTYEMFRFIPGERYGGKPAQTVDAGRTLAFFHALLVGFPWNAVPPSTSYHASANVIAQLDAITARLPDAPAPALADAYVRATQRADALGLPEWPLQVIHGDWHPGNLLFQADRVAAVLDFDAVRIEPRAVDISAAVLQFSLDTTGHDPSQWPDAQDETRVRALLEGYDSFSGPLISRAELAALGWLMIESLIAQAAGPIAAAGRFADIPGEVFLRMVQRKAAWLESNADALARVLD